MVLPPAWQLGGKLWWSLRDVAVDAELWIDWKLLAVDVKAAAVPCILAASALLCASSA
jgi:hypothetical protein